MDNALTITAVLPRGAAEDLLLRKSTAHAPVATIATGSVRRQRQTRWSNPAARVVGLRGNVPTRLRNFIESDWDAISLGRAGEDAIRRNWRAKFLESSSVSKSRSQEGKCFLVGAGPGDLGLVTLRAKELLERADVIVYDALVNPEMLDWAPVDAEIIFAGK